MSDTARIVKMIADDFYGSQLDLSERGIVSYDSWSQMPDVKFVEEMRNSGKSERTIRLFLTFVSAMDRARDANSLWQSAAELFRSHPELFEPVEAQKITLDKLKLYLSESRVSQRHGPDSKAWHVISSSLVSEDSPIRCVIDRGFGDAEELLKALKTRDEMGQSKFPLLRGPKIGPMWVRIMADPGGAKIERIEKVPVAVDVQVRRATENLGIVDTRGLKLREAKPIIQKACYNAVAQIDIGGPDRIAGTSAALDPVLWFYGKYGCSYCEKVGKQMHIGRACNHCQF
ncbi:MAG: hypothetical protein F4Y78_02810 [Candidatus Dadabacteria bacterium]|nr:hypothetical protein [Candidatus Dadabacteria bacterium]MYA49027.1 hypothetical protein [Candidatus Dadabacteria bacterium]MYF47640.1 hypothetical protein [Candidatus Dadabacteria bacterium]MYG82377.1 hypothetical protein [Candidatus Dadabacteria bacterium]MYK49472.1 hypothetical protein [Candidatus Dadabacteria bacterium]